MIVLKSLQNLADTFKSLSISYTCIGKLTHCKTSIYWVHCKLGAWKAKAVYFFVKHLLKQTHHSTWEESCLLLIGQPQHGASKYLLCLGELSFFLLDFHQLWHFILFLFQCCELSLEMPFMRSLLLVSLPPGSHLSSPSLPSFMSVSSLSPNSTFPWLAMPIVCHNPVMVNSNFTSSIIAFHSLHFHPCWPIISFDYLFL